MPRFCAKCGRLYDGTLLFINNLCAKCYFEEYGILTVPREITLHICPRCLSYKVKGKWVVAERTYSIEDAVYSALREELEAKIKPLIEGLNIRTEIKLPRRIGSMFTVVLEATVTVGAHRFSQKQNVKVNIVRELCPTCFMKASKSYKAVVQVRSVKTSLSCREKALIEKALGEIGERNIVEIEELKEGINIKTADLSTARRLALKLKYRTGAQIHETHEAVKRTREGRRTSKLIITVRLPEILEDDLVFFENELYKVSKISGTNIVLISESTGVRKNIPVEALWKGKIEKITSEHPIAKLLVVGVSDTVVYAVRVNKEYEMYEIPLSKIPRSIKVGEELKAIIINGKPYVLGKR